MYTLMSRVLSPRGILVQRRAINRVRDNAHKLAAQRIRLNPAFNVRARRYFLLITRDKGETRNGRNAF